MHDVTMRAGQLAGVTESFKALEGARPIQLSYMISKIITETDEAHGIMVERLRPFLNEDGSVQTDEPKALELLNEMVTVSVPVITIDALEQAGLKVTDDLALAFLMARGIVTSD